MIKYILFDFDGTLVDSRKIFISAFNSLASKHNFHKIDESNLAELKRLSMIGRFKYLNVPFYKVPFLTKEFLTIYREEAGSLSLIEGMHAVFESILILGIEIGIVSSNSVETIKSFLENNGIHRVSKVLCSSKLFGKDKILRKFLEVQNLDPSEVLYVCDELRDIEACDKIQVKSVWVSWGFESKEALKGAAPSFSADNPGELAKIIQKVYGDCN